MVFAFFLHSCIVPFTVYTFQFILNYIERCHTCTQTKRRNQLLTNTTRNFNEYWICAISSLQCERMTALELFVLIFGFLFFSIPLNLICVDRFGAISCGNFLLSYGLCERECVGKGVCLCSALRFFVRSRHLWIFDYNIPLVRLVHIFRTYICFPSTHISHNFLFHACENTPLINYFSNFYTHTHTPCYMDLQYMHVNAKYYTS